MLESLSVRLDALENHRAGFVACLDGLPAEARHVSPEVGAWSGAQLMEHLIASERFFRLNKPRGKPFTVATSGIRAQILNRVLSLPLRFRTPRGATAIAPASEPDFEALKTEWSTLRSSWRDGLALYQSADLSRIALRHPIAGKLTVRHALDVFIAHGRHHDRQLARIVAHAAATVPSA